MHLEMEKSLKLKKIVPTGKMKGGHFFNSYEFLNLKSFQTEGWQLIRERPIAQIFFSIEGKKAVSGRQATFGSIDLDESVSKEEMDWFINAFVKELEGNLIEEIEIRHYPSYFKKAELVQASLLSNSFKLSVNEVDQFIRVDKRSFYEVARKDEVSRADKCKKAGLQFEIAPVAKLPEIYSLVESTLLRNGHKASMSFEDLKKAVYSCPENYILFALWDTDILAAAAVSVVLSDTVLYNFYHADNVVYRSKSAMTYLLKNIYEYCQSNRFRILDLGISTENGELNRGLFNFKKQRGAVSCSKSTFNLLFNNL